MSTLDSSADPTPVLLERTLSLALELADLNADHLWSYIATLHGRPEEIVLQTAIKWLSHDNCLVRGLGACVLGQLGWNKLPFGHRSLPALLSALSDDEPLVLQSVIVSLGHHASYGQSWDCRRLLPFVTHPAAEVRWAVATALGGYPFDESSEAADLLTQLCRDQDSDVRNWAAFSLGVLGDVDTPDIRDTLSQLLSDQDHEVAGEALVGLARRKDERVVPLILNLLQQSTGSNLTIDAAGEFPSIDFLPYLESLLASNPDCNKILASITSCQNASRAG
jgi:HEAT repeat protein